jgi:serine/threonine protein kinase
VSVMKLLRRARADPTSRPYRAPELLFGSRDYDPFALDLWALGTVIAEFYTPLQQVPTSPASSRSGSPLDDDDGHETPWTRATLFNGSRSELALIGSIFRELGSPTRESWPVSPPRSLDLTMY